MKLRQAVAIGSALIFLAGCSSAPTEQEPPVTTSSSANSVAPTSSSAPTSVATTSAATPSTPLMDSTWTTAAGTKYRLVLNGPATYTPQVDGLISGSQIDEYSTNPGYGFFGFKLATTGTLYNLSELEEVPVPPMKATATWKGAAITCPFLGTKGSVAATSSAADGSKFCGLDGTIVASATTIPAGSSVTLKVTLKTTEPYSVPELDMDSVQAAFSVPYAWLVTSEDQCMASTEGVC